MSLIIVRHLPVQEYSFCSFYTKDAQFCLFSLLWLIFVGYSLETILINEGRRKSSQVLVGVVADATMSLMPVVAGKLVQVRLHNNAPQLAEFPLTWFYQDDQN